MEITWAIIGLAAYLLAGRLVVQILYWDDIRNKKPIDQEHFFLNLIVWPFWAFAGILVGIVALMIGLLWVICKTLRLALRIPDNPKNPEGSVQV